MKRCRKCLEEKSDAEFSKCSTKKDGLWIYCRTCDNLRNRNWYATPEGMAASKQKVSNYRKTEAGILQNRNACKRYKNSDRGRAWLANSIKTKREEYRARWRVKSALKSGLLNKKPCEICGKSHTVHAHHEDYSRPLNVVWLCSFHHKQRHRQLDIMI